MDPVPGRIFNPDAVIATGKPLTKVVTKEELTLNCACGHTIEEHKTASGSCQWNDGTDNGCLCGGYEQE